MSQSDQDVFIALRASEETVHFPERPRTFHQQVKLEREYFVEGMQKIAHAPGKDETMRHFMCILFESGNNKIRFTAGTGRRFVSAEYSGGSMKIASGETRMWFPSSHVSNLINVFKGADDKTMRIQSVESCEQRGVIEEIIFHTDRISITIYDVQDFTKYPDITVITKRDYPYRISTRLQDWKYASEAATASKHCYEKDFHRMKVVADLVNGCFNITTTTEMKMNRKVDFVLGTYVVDTTKSKDYKPWFCCDSCFIDEMANHAGREDTVIVNFECQSQQTTNADGADKKLTVILITYPDKIRRDINGGVKVSQVAEQ